MKGINKPVWIKYNQSTVEKKLTGRSANSSTSVIDFVDDAPLKKNSTPKQFTDQGLYQTFIDKDLMNKKGVNIA